MLNKGSTIAIPLVLITLVENQNKQKYYEE